VKKHNHFTRVLATFAVATSIAGWSQAASAPSGAVPNSQRSPATILPYTAEFKATTIQKLANGATITRESSSVRARDTQGRFYNADTQSSHAGEAPVAMFHISDPIAGTETSGDSRRKKVLIYELPPKEQRHGCWQSQSGNNQWDYGLTTEQQFPEAHS
jgi:hypothetical protein